MLNVTHMEHVLKESVNVMSLLVGEARCVKFPDVQDLVGTVLVTASVTVPRRNAFVILVSKKHVNIG